MSELELVIGNKNYSSWSLRPWIYMKHADISFTEKRIPLYSKDTNSLLEEYFSGTKVPVLIDDDLTVWDSLAILEYLAERYLEYRGWPVDTDARALARSVSAEMHSGFFAVRDQLPLNCRKKFNNFSVTQDTKKEIERITDIWKYCKDNFGSDSPWLFGDFCIADAMFAPVALRFDGYGIKLDGVEDEFVQGMVNHPFIMEWVEAAKGEKEVIKGAEVQA